MKKQMGIAMMEVLFSMGMIAVVLFSLLIYQVSLFQHTREMFFRNIALIQLENFSEMLIANQTDLSREPVFEQWNQDNADLLPKGRGIFSQTSDHFCEITLKWIFKKSEKENVVVIC